MLSPSIDLGPELSEYGALPLPLSKNPFAVQLINSNNNNKIILVLHAWVCADKIVRLYGDQEVHAEESVRHVLNVICSLISLFWKSKSRHLRSPGSLLMHPSVYICESHLNLGGLGDYFALIVFGTSTENCSWFMTSVFRERKARDWFYPNVLFYVKAFTCICNILV
jgi:hypothetical protein